MGPKMYACASKGNFKCGNQSFWTALLYRESELVGCHMSDASVQVEVSGLDGVMEECTIQFAARAVFTSASALWLEFMALSTHAER